MTHPRAASAAPAPGRVRFRDRLGGMRAWWVEPSLLRRTVLSVLLSFMIVWAVLLGYLYAQARQATEFDPGLQRFGEAVLLALNRMDDPARAAAFMDATDNWLNVRRKELGRLPGTLLFEARTPDGRRIYASPRLREARLPSPARPLQEVELHGSTHRLYEGRTARWTLLIAEPRRTTADILAFNGVVILPYLLLALPFVLLPNWLSVRGGLRPLQQLANRIAERGGDDLSPVGVTARHRELKPLVQSLDALLQRLRDKLDRERSFVQDAAHEIRTPLAVITAQAHVLAHAPDERQRAQAREHLEEAIARTSHLAQQLLSMASLDDADRAAPQRIDAAHCLRQWLAQAAPAAAARGIEMSLDAPDRLWRMADRAALESIVHNLVDNAIRYGRDNGRLAVTLHDRAGSLAFDVRDDGPGIPLRDRASVFERFRRGREETAVGSGLGLAIVRQAARRMGGTVRLGDGLGGRGAGFSVELPQPQGADGAANTDGHA